MNHVLLLVVLVASGAPEPVPAPGVVRGSSPAAGAHTPGAWDGRGPAPSRNALPGGVAAGNPAPGPFDPAADAMGEGAALKLGVAARTLAGTAAAIARDGRVGQLPVLHTDAELLVERAQRLVAILDEQERAGQVPRRAAPGAAAGDNESPPGMAGTSVSPPPDAAAPPDDGGGVAEGGTPSASSTSTPPTTAAPASATPLATPVLAPAGAPGGAKAYPPTLKGG